MHPHFPEIIDFTIDLRNRLFPSAKVSVLTNASQIGRKGVREALLKVDNAILKIDSPLEDMLEAINRPDKSYSLQRTIESMKLFKHNFILQTMFLKGEVDGKVIDCTNPEHCQAWRDLVMELQPREVMIYTIDRETPAQNLQKVTVEEMRRIAQPIIDAGMEVQIRG